MSSSGPRALTWGIIWGGITVAALGACRVEVGPPQRAQVAQEEGAPPAGRVTIYTSMYRHVIDAVVPILKDELPEVDVEWLRGGSEKLATRLDAELSAGATRADLILTSDPLWYERLHRDGHLLPYVSVHALRMPRALVHPDGAYATSRISTMVIAYNTRALTREDVPRRFEDLFKPRWAGRVTIPDPLGSGTAFTTLAFLTHRHGADLMAKMKASRTIASGGNASTLTRLESGEHDLGFVLLENVLKAQESGSPIDYVVPEEGAVLVPGPIAILKGTGNPRAAKAVYDVLLSTPVQKQIIAGLMHSPFPQLPAPPGAVALQELLGSHYAWTPEFVEATVAHGNQLRESFAQTMGAQ